MVDPVRTIPLILVVDDTPQNLQLAGAVLSQHISCELAFATGGEQAIATAQELVPDLILLDVMMPDIDGIEVCRRLRANPRTRAIPIVFLTAKVQATDLAEGFEAGGSDYITKPFDPLELETRVRNQLELRAARAALARSNEELRSMVQILCHDLANPIAAVKSLMDLGDEGEDLILELRSEIASSIDQAHAMIQLVGKLRSMEEGKFVLDLRDTLLAQSVADAKRSVGSWLKSKEVSLVADLPRNLIVHAEPTSLTNSVLANLLTNAVKFSSRGGVVTVTAAHEPHAGIVRIEVADQGIGMPEDLIATVFMTSHRSSRKGTEGESGTGFGLPLVKRFIDAYGGTIAIESRDITSHPSDHGTRVTLRIPGRME